VTKKNLRPTNSSSATNEPFPGNFICANKEPDDGTKWVSYFFTTIIVVESTLLLMAVWKAWQHRKRVFGSSLMQQMARDSVLYFFM
jgi:hypothetical protein